MNPSPAQVPAGRREFLGWLGGGLGWAALADLLGGGGGAWAGPGTPGPRPELGGGRPRRPKARRINHLVVNGGASQCDTFDYKPQLNRLHGQKFDPGGHVEAATSVPGNVLKSPWR